MKIDPQTLGLPGYELENRRGYLWWVEACNDQGCSKISSACEFTTIEAGGGPSVGGPSVGGFVCPGDLEDCPPGSVCIANPLCADTFEQLLNAIINFLLILVPAVAVVMFVIAGFLFVTSAGDPNRVGTAKKMMLYTAIGLAIVLFASGLIKVIQSILGVNQ